MGRTAKLGRRALAGGTFVFLAAFAVLSARGALGGLLSHGLALAHGIPFDAALTLALFVRALTFWLCVVLGLLLLEGTLGRGLVRRHAQS
jgi:hypothetical protein